MPRVFSPGHRPDQPLYPDDLVYSTVAKVESYLQLPDAKPSELSGDTTTASESGVTVIKIPIAGADHRRWGFTIGDVISLYDDVDALGSTLTLTGIVSGGASGVVNLKAVDPGIAYTKTNNANVQPNSILSNSSQRGISKAQVETLIRRRQDYIDRICRMAWRPRMIVDEYQNFTTFKPYRRRYYTDYVGAIYLRHRPIQRVVRMGVWQGDYYRELAASRVKLAVQKPHLFNSTDKIFFCPNIAHTATLSSGNTSTTWSKDFGVKTIAGEIGNLINEDAHTSKAAIQIGTMTESGEALNLSHEFLATANSDEGDGNVLISTMRSTDEGQDTTIAVTNRSCFEMSLCTTNDSKIITTGSTFTVADGAGFTEGNGLYYHGTGATIRVARCTRSGNSITIVDDLTSSFQSNLSMSVISTIAAVSYGGSTTVTDGTVSYATTSSGSGSGATLEVTVASNKVKTVVLNAPGTGYVVDEILTAAIGSLSITAKVNSITASTISQTKFMSDSIAEERQQDWWSMEDNGAIMFNNQYPFFENHSLKISYVYGERYLDKAIEDACTKLVALDVMTTDDYTAMFPEGTQNVDLNSKIQKLDEEVKRTLVPYQEGIIVAGMGG
jgi:hypothetical protein